MLQYISRTPVENDRQLRKILDLCKKYSLKEDYETICTVAHLVTNSQIYAQEKLKQGLYGQALRYFLEIQDSVGVDRVTRALLQHYQETKDISYAMVIQDITPDLILEKNPDAPRWLKTVHGVGYKLETARGE